MRTKRITLGPTLVVLVGPSGAGKSKWAHDNFTSQEIVSTDDLRQEYLGDYRRQDNDDLIFNEFDRRICNRLEMGLRVVADAMHIRNTNRKRTAKLAERFGARVIYVVINRGLMAKMNHGDWRLTTYVDGKDLITRTEETFVGNLLTILAGDGGVARTVIDTRSENPEIVYPLARAFDMPTFTSAGGKATIEQAPLADIVSRGYEGILFVGDIHGNLDGLVKMIKLARREKLYMIFMGDIVDYGTDTLKCADQVARLIFDGWATSVFANHEKKIYKWVTHERKKIDVLAAFDDDELQLEALERLTAGRRIDGVYDNLNGFTGQLSHGNFVTINQLKAMMPVDRFKWETRFLGMCATMPHMIRLPGYTVVHAAIGQHMLDSTEFRFGPESAQESFAMFGQTTGETDAHGFPERKYDWVDELPPRMTAVVGHDCRQELEPLVHQGATGGRAIFLDTGSSKPERFENGRLSAMSVRITSRRKMGYILETERFFNDRDLED